MTNLRANMPEIAIKNIQEKKNKKKSTKKKNKGEKAEVHFFNVFRS